MTSHSAGPEPESGSAADVDSDAERFGTIPPTAVRDTDPALGPALGDKPGDVERIKIDLDMATPLALGDGRIALFYTGGPEHNQSAYARYSIDNGVTFGEPQKLFNFPRDKGSFGGGAALVSHAGTIHLLGLDYYGFNFENRAASKSYLWHARSLDGGKTWSPVQKVDFGLEYTGASNNAFQLKSGRIIAPISALSDRRIGPWVSLAPFSDDDGATWHLPRQQITVDTGAIDWYESGAAEPVGIELNDGRVWLLPRSQDGYQWETFSTDGGLTWTPTRHSEFISNQSAMAVLRLRDSRLLLIWNNCGAEGQGEIKWGCAERAVLAAAISRDDGKTWAGYREVGRVAGNAQVSYPYATQAADGRVILFATQYLARFNPDFLEKRALTEDFAAGVRRWSTLAAKGVEAACDPDGGAGYVLRMLKPDAQTPAAACLNFPYGEAGQLTMIVRIEPGFQGAHFTISDHFDLPGLPREGNFPFQVMPNGRIMILADGGTWLDTPGDLVPGKWHTLRLAWDCRQGRATLTLDGTEIAVIEQHVRAQGACYVRVRSTAAATDSAGLYIRSIQVEVLPPTPAQSSLDSRSTMPDTVITAGIKGADFCGGDNRAIQAAIDAVAQRGGGTVRVLPGVYELQDSVHLRDNVRLVGSGAETILRKAPERSSTLTAYLGYGHYDISVADPDKFEVGMGVTIRDDNAFGFYETVATLLWRDGNRFGIDHMLNHDYSGANGGEVYSSFAPVSAEFVANVEVRDLVIDGNKDANPHFLNNCRGAGVFFLRVRNATVSGVVVRNLNGDAIGFQQCRNVRIEDCVMEDNAGHGLHPGSGSVGGVIRRCTATRNGHDGVFFCLRASHIICDSCSFIGNGDHGVSIGGRDTNNAIVGCRIEGNGGAGVYFRDSDEVMAPHVTLIARNTIANNCASREDAEVLIEPAVRDVHVLDNAIEHRAGSRPVFGIRVGSKVLGACIAGNRFAGEFTEQMKVECDAAAVSLARPDRDLPVGPDAAPPGADRHLPPAVRD